MRFTQYVARTACPTCTKKLYTNRASCPIYIQALNIKALDWIISFPIKTLTGIRILSGL
jgi:hypothetical protein